MTNAPNALMSDVLEGLSPTPRRAGVGLTSPAPYATSTSMPTNDLQSCVDAFTTDLASIIQKAAFAAVREVLNQTQSAPGATPARRKPGRPVGSTTAARRTAAAGRSAAASKRSAKPGRASAAKRRQPGEKRDPKVLEAVIEKLLAHVRANPGQRMEVIGAALGLPRNELALPTQKLLADGKITRKGVKRATEYFASSSSSTSNGGLVLVKRKKTAVEATGAAGGASASAASAP
jgi:hypothetical protein